MFWGQALFLGGMFGASAYESCCFQLSVVAELLLVGGQPPLCRAIVDAQCLSLQRIIAPHAEAIYWRDACGGALAFY